MGKVLVIGTYVLDVVVRDGNEILSELDNINIIKDCKITIGGNGSNVSYYLSKLGHDVATCGRIADDYAGKYIYECMKNNSIGVNDLKIMYGGKTGISVILVDNNGEKRIEQYLGENENFILDNMTNISKYDLIVISGIGLLPKLEETLPFIIKKIKKNNIPIVVDTSANVRKLRSKIVSGLLKDIDYFIPNEREAKEIACCSNIKDSAIWLLNQGISNVIIKCGRDGCYYHGKNDKFMVKGFETKVVDTTGSGDAFVAGFISKLLAGRNVLESLIFANALGAECAKNYSAIIDDINENFLRLQYGV